MSTPLRPALAPRSVSRRNFIGSASVGLCAMALGCGRGNAAPDPAAKQSQTLPAKVRIVEFADNGARLRVAELPTVKRTEAQWRAQLSPLAFDVTRKDGTERAFTGALLKEKRAGVYRCVCCNTALFNANTKFESGTGWPSFWKPIASQNVRELRDLSYGMVRTEVACARCDAHLGHVFDDGPRPTGLRYCMNSVSLAFAPA